MPWCPKCKNEYQEGFTVCADCGSALVDELPAEDDRIAVAFIEEEELAGKLAEYLNYNAIDSVCEYDDEQDSFAVKVNPEDLDAAKAAFRAFYKVETAREADQELAEKIRSVLSKHLSDKAGGEDDTDNDPLSENDDHAKGADRGENTDGAEDVEDALESLNVDDLSDEEKQLLAKAIVSEQVYKPAGVYVTKSDVSKDMFSTAITFLVFAVGLFVFLILNLTNVITLFNNTASIVTIGVLSIGCCLVGINAIKRSRKAELASHEEERLTADIKQWFEDSISDDLFDGLKDEDLTEEILYFKRVEIIRSRLNEAFPNLDDDFADAMIDDFYDERFPAEDSEETADDADNPSDNSTNSN
ncbi:MAG: hypothetical protein K6E85_17425 [Lachnospiraceae bacterium]|nr:hypothetical protein [Lachnospiraceae bacterium]